MSWWLSRSTPWCCCGSEKAVEQSHLWVLQEWDKSNYGQWGKVVKDVGKKLLKNWTSIHHLLVVWLWISHFLSLGLWLIISEMEIPPTDKITEIPNIMVYANNIINCGAEHEHVAYCFLLKASKTRPWVRTLDTIAGIWLQTRYNLE